MRAMVGADPQRGQSQPPAPADLLVSEGPFKGWGRRRSWPPMWCGRRRDAAELVLHCHISLPAGGAYPARSTVMVTNFPLKRSELGVPSTSWLVTAGLPDTRARTT